MPSFRNAPVDVVIDVRSKLEFWLGHLPGAINVPVDQLPEGLRGVSGVTEQSRLLVYCASGGRSAAAAAALRASGFRRVTDAGGMSDARADYAA